MNKITASSLLFLCVIIFEIKPSFASDEIELNGLVIDRTLTRFGKDFTFHYAGYWRELPYTQGYNVTLTETVYPQAGTMLIVEINGSLIYRTHFGRRMSSVEDRAKQAMLITIDHLAQLQANQFNNSFNNEFDGY